MELQSPPEVSEAGARQDPDLLSRAGDLPPNAFWGGVLSEGIEGRPSAPLGSVIGLQ
jgi:hypothetical protein